MPLVNYCRKCKAEVPLGETCAYCGAPLSQTGEQISFGLVRKPVNDWFAWNSLLRIVLPVMALVCAAVLAAEAAVAGQAGVIRLLEQGFLTSMLSILALMLAVIWGLLALQGREKVHVLLDKQGVHVRTYLSQQDDLALYMRFLTPAAAERLQESDDRPALEGLRLVKRVTLPWQAVRRVRIWREGMTILFFRPSFWQAAAIRCPADDLPAAEELVRKKLKRFKKVKITPAEQTEKKKKR